ncbi:MAPEG family protein [Viridibacterium curvum]|uniref:MAPEG family protein n=1 Tax=Viridibacterium curvum TaxID=1101404 RepID=A0ABP9QCC4_9RHOO
MNQIWLCLLITCFMPYLFAAAAKASGASGGRRYDNSDPRTWLAGLSGWPARAQAAQANSWEALAIFIAGLVAALHGGVPEADIVFWSWWFVVARVIYGALYIANLATARSVVWLLAVYAPLHLIARVL